MGLLLIPRDFELLFTVLVPEGQTNTIYWFALNILLRTYDIWIIWDNFFVHWARDQGVDQMSVAQQEEPNAVMAEESAYDYLKQQGGQLYSYPSNGLPDLEPDAV